MMERWAGLEGLERWDVGKFGGERSEERNVFKRLVIPRYGRA